jgi:hypothetical protein
MSSRANDVFAGTLTVLYSTFGGAGGAAGAAADAVGAGASATDDEAEPGKFDVAAALEADFVDAVGLADLAGATGSGFAREVAVVSAAGDAGALDSDVATGVVAGVS